jgi:hypothetical protein
MEAATAGAEAAETTGVLLPIAFLPRSTMATTLLLSVSQAIFTIFPGCPPPIIYRI